MYAILTREGKRAREKDGSLTPVFKYPIQAWNYIGKHLGDSPAFKVKKI